MQRRIGHVLRPSSIVGGLLVVVGLGMVLTPGRYTSASYEVLRTWLTIRVWGGLWLTFGALAIAHLRAWTAALAVALLAAWAAGTGLAFFHGAGAPTAPAWPTSLVLLLIGHFSRWGTNGR